MNFLQLCQMVARESGTISGLLPTAVVGQDGRLLKVVSWTQSAWTKIQNDRRSWRWMYGEFNDTTTVTSAGTARYTATSWNLNRLANWVVDAESMSIYDAAIGVSDENLIIPMSWDMYRRQFVRGAQTPGRPQYYAISPANEICFGPVPDREYSIRGEYYKNPQTLVEATDVPELPARFHEVIGWYGLLLLAEHDEGQYHTQVAYRRYSELMGDIRRDQLPRIAIGADALA